MLERSKYALELFINLLLTHLVFFRYGLVVGDEPDLQCFRGLVQRVSFVPARVGRLIFRSFELLNGLLAFALPLLLRLLLFLIFFTSFLFLDFGWGRFLNIIDDLIDRS